MKKIILFIFILSIKVCLSQTVDSTYFSQNNDKIDSTEYYYSQFLNCCKIKWATIGFRYELFNSTYGIEISNGIDERPLMHFEDFSEDLMFKLNALTNFKTNYSFQATLARHLQINYLSIISCEYQIQDYSEIDYFHHDISISAKSYWNLVNSGIIFKTGFQTLNDYNNFGANIGFQKIVHSKSFYITCIAGYYFDYFTYNAILHGFIYKNSLSLRLEYEKKYKYNFINLGVNLTIRR
jgi:hypothetical protein